MPFPSVAPSREREDWVKDAFATFELLQVIGGLVSLVLFAVPHMSTGTAVILGVASALFLLQLSIQSIAQVFGVRSMKVLPSMFVQLLVITAISIVLTLVLGLSFGSLR